MNIFALRYYISKANIQNKFKRAYSYFWKVQVFPSGIISLSNIEKLAVPNRQNFKLSAFCLDKCN